MKKLLVGLVVTGVLLTAKHLNAQGAVTFVNSTTSYVMTNAVAIGGGSGRAATTASGGNIRVALYWGVVGSTEAQLVQIGSSTGISPVPGRINGGNYTTGSATAPGATATFQVRGWMGAYSTYEAAYADGAVVGVGPLFNSPTAGNGTPPAAPVSLANSMPGFLVLTIVPEPSTYAFLGMGILGLFWKRFRRKCN